MTETQQDEFVDRVIEFMRGRTKVSGAHEFNWKVNRTLIYKYRLKLGMQNNRVLHSLHKVWGQLRFVSHFDLSISRFNYDTLLLSEKWAECNLEVDPFHPPFKMKTTDKIVFKNMIDTTRHWLQRIVVREFDFNESFSATTY